LPFVAFASYGYTRNPLGSPISSPVSFSVNFDDYVIDLECDSGQNAWGLEITDRDYENKTYSSYVSSSTLSHTFIVPLPAADYWEIQISCADDLAGSNSVTGINLETGSPTFIISSPAAVSTEMFTIPTSTATDITANVTSALGDPGFLTVVALAAGIPLVFYVVKQLIGLLPKSRGRQ
jgi:hypothetical protein